MQDNNSRDTSGEVKDKVKQDFGAAQEEMTSKAKQQAESGKEQAADQVDNLSEAIDSVAASLSEQDKDGLAAYAHQASEKLAGLADHIHSRSLDQLTEDAKRIARERPAAFMLGSVAIGFGLSRFFKASEHHSAGSTDQGQYPARAATANSNATMGGGSGYASRDYPSNPANVTPSSPGTTPPLG